MILVTIDQALGGTRLPDILAQYLMHLLFPNLTQVDYTQFELPGEIL